MLSQKKRQAKIKDIERKIGNIQAYKAEHIRKLNDLGYEIEGNAGIKVAELSIILLKEWLASEKELLKQI